MANKIIVGFYDSQSGLPINTKALVFAATSLVPVNTADTVTGGNYNSFSFTLTEYASGVRFYRVLLIDADDANAPISSYGWIDLPSDTDGTYYVDSLPSLDLAAFEADREANPDPFVPRAI